MWVPAPSCATSCSLRDRAARSMSSSGRRSAPPPKIKHKTKHGIKHGIEHGIEHGIKHGSKHGIKHRSKHGLQDQARDVSARHHGRGFESNLWLRTSCARAVGELLDRFFGPSIKAELRGVGVGIDDKEPMSHARAM